jgi:succinate dehydrogenase/fumarate reductase flavoprotein subunit
VPALLVAHSIIVPGIGEFKGKDEHGTMRTSPIVIGKRHLSLVLANTIIVGAGAAGMNCAVQLVKHWRQRGVKDPQDRVLVVTGSLGGGASRMSGSDKQTYYKMGTSPRVPDTAEDFAKTLTAFGCCHGDTALVEGICSLRGFYNLIEAGVPFPHDPFGAFIGYKTDHDPYERATSAGPKTSRFMSQCLQAEAQRMGIRIVDKHPVVEFVTTGSTGPYGRGALPVSEPGRDGPATDKRIVAMVCIDMSRASGNRPALAVFVAENWVLAAGGPGEIYQATVYPRGQYGIHGPALMAGLEACNLTESQYGLASIKFRWNVSGTYMQVVPRIFSTDADGRDEREFLTEYFDDMPSMATNIFLKGYQGPFDAQRIIEHRSSLIDMAVHQETVVRGRRVWMDFLKNPVGPSGTSGQGRPAWEAFRIERLRKEALEYLQKTGALQARPVERLEHMNLPAIDIYSENGIDLRKEPLEIALCAQHNNGGFAINKWWESSLRHTFVIGEMAGTHGVKRPGGSALNAGQVGAMRAAEYIANVYGSGLPRMSAAKRLVQAGVAEVMERLDDLLEKRRAASVTPDQAMDDIRRRMTRFGAHLRWKAGAADALRQAKEQYRRLLADGLKFASTRQLPAAVRAIQQCLTHVAMFKAICGMLDRGAGSRGSHCVLDEGGVEMHPALTDPATGKPYRFRPENEALRNSILHLRYHPAAEDLFDPHDVPPRPIPKRDIAFEPAWAEFREGKIYRA